MNILDRKKGCMYGLAIGDALGAAVEFMRPGTFKPVTGYRDGGMHDLKPGEWTDDTSMALALADSIASGWSMADQLDRYVDWYKNGKYSVNGKCFDIGHTTWLSLEAYLSNGIVKKEPSGSGGGNGSMMRLAPVTIRYHDDKDLTKYLQESSETTHNGYWCVMACVYLGHFTAALFQGERKINALMKAELEVFNYCRINESFAWANFIDNINWCKGKIHADGFVLNSLKAAVWAFMTADSFEEAVFKAVNLGDDADTTGAICGQLAGACWGYHGIPRRLTDSLARKDMIDRYLNPILL